MTLYPPAPGPSNLTCASDFHPRLSDKNKSFLKIFFWEKKNESVIIFWFWLFQTSQCRSVCSWTKNLSSSINFLLRKLLLFLLLMLLCCRCLLFILLFVFCFCLLVLFLKEMQVKINLTFKPFRLHSGEIRHERYLIFGFPELI